MTTAEHIPYFALYVFITFLSVTWSTQVPQDPNYDFYPSSNYSVSNEYNQPPAYSQSTAPRNCEPCSPNSTCEEGQIHQFINF